MDKRIVGREYISSTKCHFEDDGTWKAINEIVDRVLYEGDTEWVEESVNAMSFDAACNTAIQTAMGSTLNYLLQNVYQNGFNGLVEYREYERSMKNDSQLQSPSTETPLL